MSAFRVDIQRKLSKRDISNVEYYFIHLIGAYDPRFFHVCSFIRKVFKCSTYLNAGATEPLDLVRGATEFN